MGETGPGVYAINQLRLSTFDSIASRFKKNTGPVTLVNRIDSRTHQDLDRRHTPSVHDLLCSRPEVVFHGNKDWIFRID
jgi:hypothetical protein